MGVGTKPTPHSGQVRIVSSENCMGVCCTRGVASSYGRTRHRLAGEARCSVSQVSNWFRFFTLSQSQRSSQIAAGCVSTKGREEARRCPVLIAFSQVVSCSAVGLKG